MKIRMIAFAACALLFVAVVACEEEGPMERAGNQLDEAVEELQHGGEGTLEGLGREIDEAVGETKEAADEVAKKMQKQ